MFTNEQMDLTFQALSHETRRTILDCLRDHPGLTVGELARQFDVSRIAVMNHLTVLEKAGLVISRKDGRSRRLFLNLVPIQMIYDRWTDAYSGHFASRLTQIKYAAEQAAAQGKDTP